MWHKFRLVYKWNRLLCRIEGQIKKYQLFLNKWNIIYEPVIIIFITKKLLGEYYYVIGTGESTGFKINMRFTSGS